jgi:L-fuconolactonase
MRIDCHHHLWNYTPEEYGWIGPDKQALKRDFILSDLKRTARQSGIEGSIVVQARQSLEETGTLLDLALRENFVRGVIGWLPITSREFPGLLERYAENPELVGIRHVIQDEPDDSFILGMKFNAGIGLLSYYRLVYEILVFERHLPQTIRFVTMHPDQQFVLDHCAKPLIASGTMEPWRGHIRELAKRPNVACKISGLVTEADASGNLDSQCSPYLETVLEAFGPDRCLFGSDWPVCLTACGYGEWHRMVSDAVSGLSAPEQAKIFGDNAARIYRLKEVS